MLAPILGLLLLCILFSHWESVMSGFESHGIFLVGVGSIHMAKGTWFYLGPSVLPWEQGRHEWVGCSATPELSAVRAHAATPPCLNAPATPHSSETAYLPKPCSSPFESEKVRFCYSP